MQVSGISSTIARAIVAADRQTARSDDPRRVPRLEVDEHGQLRVMKVAMHEVGGRPEDFGPLADGYTAFATVETWHPIVVAIARPTVAQVLAQLPDDVREQVTAVQLLDRVTHEVIRRAEDDEDTDGWHAGWVIMRTRLFRS